MVRKYVRKTKRGESYSKEKLAKAVDDVSSGRINVYQASSIYNIPKTTIVDHLKGRRGQKSSSFGRATALSVETESKLAAYLKTMQKSGFGLSRKEVLNLVGEYVNANNLKTPFKDGVPSEDWFLRFKKSQNLSLRKPQSVEFLRRKSCDPFILGKYFEILSNTLSELGLENKPDQIWNLDESGFSNDPSRTKTVGPKGLPTTRTTSSSGRENTTVLLACSAAGSKAPPLIIYKGKNIWSDWYAPEGCGFPDTVYAASCNGWMETSIFVNYFEKCFLKVAAPSVEKPVLLIYDGHSTHVGLKLIELATANHVTIIKLPPHSSHLLQPLDLSVFKSLKTAWDQFLCKWQRQHPGQKLPRNIFAKTLGEIWLKTDPTIIVNGFRKGGIFPLNRNIIPEENFEPAALNRWKNHNNALAQTNDIHPSTSSNSQSDSPGPSSANGISISKNKSELNEEATSFEDLLLKSLKGNPLEKSSRKRVAEGATVLTSKEAIDFIKSKEIEKQQKLNKVKSKKLPFAKKKLQSLDESTDSEYSTQESDNENLEDILEREVDEQNHLEEISRDISTRTIGDWILTKFPGKKIVKYFVGQIRNEKSSDSDMLIQFVRKQSENEKNTMFCYPTVEDVAEIAEDQVVSILPEPRFGRRGEIIFDVTFANYNLQ